MYDAIDLHRLLGALNAARAALDLDTADLCNLVALLVTAERGNLTSLGGMSSALTPGQPVARRGRWG